MSIARGLRFTQLGDRLFSLFSPLFSFSLLSSLLIMPFFFHFLSPIYVLYPIDPPRRRKSIKPFSVGPYNSEVARLPSPILIRKHEKKKIVSKSKTKNQVIHRFSSSRPQHATGADQARPDLSAIKPTNGSLRRGCLDPTWSRTAPRVLFSSHHLNSNVTVLLVFSFLCDRCRYVLRALCVLCWRECDYVVRPALFFPLPTSLYN